jgi:hypothetical protein
MEVVEKNLLPLSAKELQFFGRSAVKSHSRSECGDDDRYLCLCQESNPGNVAYEQNKLKIISHK